MGYAVDDTADAGSGLEMALGDTYDLILLDVKLPKEDLPGLVVHAPRQFQKADSGNPCAPANPCAPKKN